MFQAMAWQVCHLFQTGWPEKSPLKWGKISSLSPQDSRFELEWVGWQWQNSASLYHSWPNAEHYKHWEQLLEQQTKPLIQSRLGKEGVASYFKRLHHNNRRQSVPLALWSRILAKCRGQQSIHYLHGTEIVVQCNPNGMYCLLCHGPMLAGRTSFH
jgi:hypothetical protein